MATEGSRVPVRHGFRLRCPGAPCDIIHDAGAPPTPTRGELRLRSGWARPGAGTAPPSAVEGHPRSSCGSRSVSARSTALWLALILLVCYSALHGTLASRIVSPFDNKVFFHTKPCGTLELNPEDTKDLGRDRQDEGGRGGDGGQDRPLTGARGATTTRQFHGHLDRELTAVC